MPPLIGWSAFALLGGVFATIAFINARFWWRSVVRKEVKVPSAIPILGGVVGYAAFKAAPMEALSDAAWLALWLDVGCAPALALSVPLMAREQWRISRFNVLHEFRGAKDGKVVRLRLFRGQRFVLKFQNKASAGPVTRTASGHWDWADGRLTLHMEGSDLVAAFEPVDDASPQTLRQTSGFTVWENDEATSLAGVDLVRGTLNRGARLGPDAVR